LILLDTSGLYAALSTGQPEHQQVREALEHEEGPFFLSPFVLAEADYMIQKNVGIDAELALLHEVERGAYTLVPFSKETVAEARAVIERYRGLGIGLADASIVVLARIIGTTRVLTLDERDFRAMKTPEGLPFTLLPADL
jgi:predicted nucleic acid-binding protein